MALRPWTLNANCDLDSVSFPNSSAKLPEPLPFTVYVLILVCSVWRRWHLSEPTSISSAFPCLLWPQRALSLLPSLRVEQQPRLPLPVLGTTRSMTSPGYHEEHDQPWEGLRLWAPVPAGDPHLDLFLWHYCQSGTVLRSLVMFGPIQFDWLIHSFFPCWKK